MCLSNTLVQELLSRTYQFLQIFCLVHRLRLVSTRRTRDLHQLLNGSFHSNFKLLLSLWAHQLLPVFYFQSTAFANELPRRHRGAPLQQDLMFTSALDRVGTGVQRGFRQCRPEVFSPCVSLFSCLSLVSCVSLSLLSHSSRVYLSSHLFLSSLMSISFACQLSLSLVNDSDNDHSFSRLSLCPWCQSARTLALSLFGEKFAPRIGLVFLVQAQMKWA